ncbi:MAG: hypothetical protein ACXWN9_14030, partial [Candidatus Binataceae bacterium]
LPAEAAFISLGCAYFAALCATHWATSREARPQTDAVPIQPAAKEAAALSLRARLELERDL